MKTYLKYGLAALALIPLLLPSAVLASYGSRFSSGGGGGSGERLLFRHYAADWQTEWSEGDCLPPGDRLDPVVAGCPANGDTSANTQYHGGTSQWVNLPGDTILVDYGCVEYAGALGGPGDTDGLGASSIEIFLYGKSAGANRLLIAQSITLRDSVEQEGRLARETVLYGAGGSGNHITVGKTLNSLWEEGGKTYSDHAAFLLALGYVNNGAEDASHTGILDLDCWVQFE